MRHIMVDCETLSTNSNALIISISAVEFDLDTGEIGKTFEIGLDILDQALNEAVIDKDTLSWWATQDAEAKKSLTRLRTISITNALIKFNLWLSNIGHPINDIKLWGNGCTADNVWVRNLYKRHNVTFILPYWCDNDVRTLVTLGGINTRDFKFEGIKHNGIDDCKHQINYCVVANNKYKGIK